MKISFVLVILLVVSGSSVYPSSPAILLEPSQDGTLELMVVYTHDIHSHLYPDWIDSGCDGGMSLLATKVNDLRASNNVLLLDCGDTLSGGAVNDHNKGKPLIEVMNAIGYNAMAIDNHEFDQGVDVLEVMIETADFDIVSTNVEWPGTTQPADYTTVTIADYRIGIIGLTPSFWYAPEEVSFSSLTSAATSAVDDLEAEGVNFIVLLGSLSSDLASSVPNIDILLKSSGPEFIGDTLCLPSVETHASGMGVASLSINTAAGSIESYTFSTIDLTTPIQPDPTTEGIITSWENLMEIELDRPVGYVSSTLSRGMLGELMADAIRSATGADIATYNYGGVRDVILPGFITYRDLYRVEPFFNYIATIDVPGSLASTLVMSNYDSTDISSFDPGATYTLASSNFSITSFEKDYTSDVSNRQDYTQDTVIEAMTDYINEEKAVDTSVIHEVINEARITIAALPDSSISGGTPSSSRSLMVNTLDAASEGLNQDDEQTTVAEITAVVGQVTSLVSCSCAKRWLVTELNGIVYSLGGTPASPVPTFPWEIIILLGVVGVIIILMYFIKIRR